LDATGINPSRGPLCKSEAELHHLVEIMKAMKRGRGLIANAMRWGGFVALCGAALLRAATAATEHGTAAAAESERREAFAIIAENEAPMRARTEKNFPWDQWSQDDNYHAVEMDRCAAFANLRGLSIGAVLQAVDDGMREGWPRPAGAIMKATVAPCHPRPVD
jgi:hypothetical protein